MNKDYSALRDPDNGETITVQNELLVCKGGVLFRLSKVSRDLSHWKFKDSLTAQRILRRLSPVHFYYPHLGLGSEQMYYEWALLDTHDGTTDFYKHHRSIAKIESHLERLGSSEISVWKGGNGVEAFCRRPK